MHHDGAVAGRRATDAERDACVARLTDAYVSGALPLDDLHERTDRALAAQHVGELAVLVQDLDDPVTAAPLVLVRRRGGRRRRRLVTFGVSGLVVVAVAAALGVTAAQPPEPEALTSSDVCVSTGLRPDADGPLGGRCPVPSRAQVAILEAEAQARTSFQYARGFSGGASVDDLVAQARDGRDRAVAAATTSRQAVAVDRATPALLRRLEREAEQAGEQARRAALDLAALGRERDAPRR